ncbi:MAG: Cna B-type domain-containing protein, partial [Clostridiales bacterium]|nr:Cna B-type domain-containing protein [Clostridiales bacterium]
KVIDYTVTEESVDNYTAVIAKAEDGTFSYTITNSYETEKTEATVKKVWVDDDNQDRVRPASITVTLVKDGVATDTTKTLSEDNGWTATVTGLEKYENGQLVKYTWTEENVPKGYTASDVTEGTKTTITNKHVSALTEVTVKKVWVDANNQDGIRPESLTVKLSTGAEVTLNKENGWTQTVKNLPKYKDGVEIEYTWTEENVPEGYIASYVTEGTETTITNSHVPATTSATVKKVWSDSDNKDGMRPANLVVSLSNGDSVTLNEDNGWTATIDDLPKYDNGEEIKYTWSEGDVDGYVFKSQSRDGTITTITNELDLDAVKTSVSVKKVWVDKGNEDKRPENLLVVLSNGSEVTLNENNGWTATVDGLSKYDEEGNVIEYTWSESTLPDGYEVTTSVDGSMTTLTNTYTKTQEEVKGSILIKKALGSGAPDSAKSKTYTFKVIDPNGKETTVEIIGAGEKELTDLVPGKYTITEDKENAKISGYVLSVANGEVTLTISADNKDQTVTVTNDYTLEETQPTDETQSTDDTTPTGGDTAPTDETPSTDDTTPTGGDTAPTGGDTAPTDGTQSTDGSKPTDGGSKPTDSGEDDATKPTEGTSNDSSDSSQDAPTEASPVPTPETQKEISSVEIDGQSIKPEDYTKKNDGTVELTAACIEKLTLGKHRVKVTYTDGSSFTVEFEVVSSTSRDGGKKIVKTGDTSDNFAPVITAVFMILVAAAAVVVMRKRREDENS